MIALVERQEIETPIYMAKDKKKDLIKDNIGDNPRDDLKKALGDLIASIERQQFFSENLIDKAKKNGMCVPPPLSLIIFSFNI